MAKGQTYDNTFKREAVRLVESSRKSMRQIAEDLGISLSALSRRCQDVTTNGERAFIGSGNLQPEAEELRRLRRENETFRQERDILKKQPCRSATPMSMKILSKRPRGILWKREALRSRQTQWSHKPDKKAG